MDGVLVIGIGHPDRGDDAAGLLVARRLAANGPIPLDVRECAGDLATLVDAWIGAEGVVLIDATVGGGAPGDIRVVDLLVDAPPADRGGSSHGFGLAEAIALSRALGTLPRALRLVGIEGARFDVGAHPSAAVLAALPAAAAAARAESLRLIATLS
jgi:hydrogenase maturation protease